MSVKFTAAEAAGLWQAVNWMNRCLQFAADPDEDAAALENERKKLAAARSGLRKVQQLRREDRVSRPKRAIKDPA